MDPTTEQQPERMVQWYPAETVGPVTVRTARRMATLERSSQRLIKSAGLAGVDVTYLGIAPLFDEPRAYAGPRTDWIIRPAVDRSDAVVPAAERARLQRLLQAGIDFPLVYVAHEIHKGQVAVPAGPVALDHATAAAAVGPVPPPADATALAARLGHSSEQLLAFLRGALRIAGATAAAPFVLAGAALSGLAAGLDPIVFGVVPASQPLPGQPAAWYVLARWEWPDAPGPASSKWGSPRDS
jgi:hypothetical protein